LSVVVNFQLKLCMLKINHSKANTPACIAAKDSINYVSASLFFIRFFVFIFLFYKQSLENRDINYQLREKEKNCNSH